MFKVGDKGASKMDFMQVYLRDRAPFLAKSVFREICSN